MFGNALFNPSNTPYASPRRHSHLDVSIAPKISQRRSTMPMIDVSGMSPGLGSMMGTPYSSRGPHTPCFVTPTLGGFSGRRFSYDSPLQTIQTLSSAGLPTLNKKAAKRAWAKMSTKKWSRPCKITAILLLCSFAVTLFLVRKMKESSVILRHASCNDETGTCDAFEAHHHENNPKENFMVLVSSNDNHNHYVEEPSDLWVNRWGVKDIEETLDTHLDTSNESEVHVVEQESLGLEDLPSKMIDYVESVKTFIGDNISGSDSKAVVESAAESAADPVEVSLNSLEFSPSKSVQEPTPVQQTRVPAEMKKHHVHVLDGVTSYHGNTHYHAVWGEKPEPMQAPVKPVHQKPQSVPRYQPGLPQHPTGNFHIPISGAPAQMNGIPAQPLHHRPQQGYGAPPAPGMPQQYHNQHASGMPQQFHGQHVPGMPQQYHNQHAPGMPQQVHGQHVPGLMPQHGHQVAPGINPVHYNQQYHQPQYHHNQGGIIGHNPPHHNAHQNNDQRAPPGVNPHRYMGL